VVISPRGWRGRSHPGASQKTLSVMRDTALVVDSPRARFVGFANAEIGLTCCVHVAASSGGEGVRS
jgi:hypothetical protein